VKIAKTVVIELSYNRPSYYYYIILYYMSGPQPLYIHIPSAQFEHIHVQLDQNTFLLLIKNVKVFDM